MTKPFNWRDYIRVADDFGADKALIERALDDIAATGEDGQQLIKLGYKHSPHQTWGKDDIPPPPSKINILFTKDCLGGGSSFPKLFPIAPAERS